MRFNSSSALDKENNSTATLCVLFGNQKGHRGVPFDTES
jgi:hypothetical protein